MNVPEVYMGIMSGTSLDAIDVAVCSFDEVAHTVNTLAFHSLPWPTTLRAKLLEFATSDSASIDDLTRAGFTLAEQYAEAVRQTLAKANLRSNHIHAIGLHGQTIRHLPTPESLTPELPATGATWQLGNGSALAAKTGIHVVHDFRSADVALGGQGAPLVPMFDAEFLRSSSHDRAILNIGGIANVTILQRHDGTSVRGFDCGPGNMLIDGLAQEYFGIPFDRDGEIAARGSVNEQLLNALLGHSYFGVAGPKSTGRELFGAEFRQVFTQAIDEHSLTLEDALATATELTARSIADALARLDIVSSDLEIIVSGGGAYNTFLLERLQKLTKSASVLASTHIGIEPQAKECIAFAYFARANMLRQTIHLPSTTGASHATILGSLSRGHSRF